MDLPVIEIIGILATVLAVIGVLANNRQLRWCFLIWFISNVLSAGIHAHALIWSLFIRDIVFVVLAIEGWIRWGRNTK